MHVYSEGLSDVSRYIENNRNLSLDDHRPVFESYLERVGRFIKIDSSTRILEIGIGTGWFPILCEVNGLSCKGLEISPQLIEYACRFGRAYGVEPDIELGNVEDCDLGKERYDVIIASSVFEHIEDWRTALAKVYAALKPGGVLFFESSNKFSLTSGEFHFPLYGWLPDFLRYRLRIARQGPDIMKLGIDFNQFTYPLLRRTFSKLGFTQVFDRLTLARPQTIVSPLKRFLVRVGKQFRPVGELTLLFADTTTFVCVK
jgi:SAM-dependent methyltransferase